MRTTDKNKRYPIPEFHYEISRNGELWNTNTGRLIRPGSDGRYLLRKQKRMYRFTYGRLLYAAEHGICPDSCGMLRRKREIWYTSHLPPLCHIS